MPRTTTDWEAEWEKIQKESRKLAKRANQRLKRLEIAAKKPGMSNILKYAYKSAVADTRTLGKVEGKPRFKETVKKVDVFDEAGKLLTGSALAKANVMIQRTKIKMMKEFLGSASSTIGGAISGAAEGINKSIGIKRIWSKANKTINEKYLSEYDLRMSDDDRRRFFNSRKQAKLEKDVGSPRMFVVASIMKKYNLKSNKRDFEKFAKSHINLDKLEDPSIVDARKGEKFADYLDRIGKYIEYTDDKILNNYVNDALKSGINVDNIFSDEKQNKKSKK